VRERSGGLGNDDDVKLLDARIWNGVGSDLHFCRLNRYASTQELDMQVRRNCKPLPTPFGIHGAETLMLTGTYRKNGIGDDEPMPYNVVRVFVTPIAAVFT
jgi:hypothetical protein